MRRGSDNMALYTPEYQPTGDEVAVINTSKGTVRVQLMGKDAPIHVGNFVELAQKGFYDGLKFHRYVPGFVIQGGCPNTRDFSGEEVAEMVAQRRGTFGTGNPGYSIKEEYTTNPHNEHKDGTLAMARWLPVLPVPGRPAHARRRLHRVRPAARGARRHP